MAQGAQGRIELLGALFWRGGLPDLLAGPGLEGDVILPTKVVRLRQKAVGDGERLEEAGQGAADADQQPGHRRGGLKCTLPDEMIRPKIHKKSRCR